MDPAAVAAQFEPLISAFPDWHWEIRHLVVDGDYIAVHFTVTGTHRGAFQGIEATGRRVIIPEFTLYRLEDGKFAEVWDHTDIDGVMRQMDLDPACWTRLIPDFSGGSETIQPDGKKEL